MRFPFIQVGLLSASLNISSSSSLIRAWATGVLWARKSISSWTQVG